jgi:thymidine kinase
MSSTERYANLNGIPIDDQELKFRLSALKEIVVSHTRFNQLYDMIRDSHLLHEGVVILGDTGAGKTTLFKAYEAKFPRERKVKFINKFEIKYDSIPVLRVELDSNSSPLNVASKMLEVLGDPFYSKGTEKQLTARLKKSIVDAEVELIIIDELQHLVDTDTQRVIRKASDWVKQLLNDLNLPIVFGGIEEDATKIFAHNKQLDERFPHKESFSGFKFSNEKEIKEFRVFLKTIDVQLPFPERSNLYDPYLVTKIYYATLGIPRTLFHLLHHSSKIALKSGKDKLEELHLEEGFKLLTYETRPRVINPFDGKVFDLKVALEKEKLKK